MLFHVMVHVVVTMSRLLVILEQLVVKLIFVMMYKTSITVRSCYYWAVLFFFSTQRTNFVYL